MNDESGIPSEGLAVILARLEVKLDHALARGEDHEVRIRNVESKVVRATGAAAAIASILTAGGSVIFTRLLG